MPSSGRACLVDAQLVQTALPQARQFVIQSDLAPHPAEAPPRWVPRAEMLGFHKLLSCPEPMKS